MIILLTFILIAVLGIGGIYVAHLRNTVRLDQMQIEACQKTIGHLLERLRDVPVDAGRHDTFSR